MSRKLNDDIKRLLVRHQVEGGELDGGVLSDEESSHEKAKKVLDKIPEYWGARKNAYYKVDAGDSGKREDELGSDFEEAIVEEEEALALQRQRLALVEKNDFLGYDTESHSDTEEEKDDDDEAELSDAADTELLQRDFQNFSVEQLGEHINQVCPDFGKLSSELVHYNKELDHIVMDLKIWKRDIAPLLSTLVRIGVLSISRSDHLKEVEDYLNTKAKIISCYLTNIAYYLATVSNDYGQEDPAMRTAAAASQRSQHPVVERIARFGSFLTRLEVLVEGRHRGKKSKGKPHFKSVIEVFRQLVKEKDALKESISFYETKPTAKHEGQELAEAESDGDYEKSDEERLSESSETDSEPEFKSLKANGVQPLKAIHAFDESLQASELDLLEKRKKQEQSRFQVSRIDETLTKKQRDLEARRSVSGDADVPCKDRKRRLEELGVSDPAQLTMLEEKAEQFSSGESDDETSSQKLVRKRPADVSSDDGQSDASLDYYYKAAQDRAQRLADKEVSAGGAPVDNSVDYDENDLGLIDGKRDATFEILKNKGLKAHKKKLDRNPRLKRRKKFESAVKKLSSTRRVVKDRHTAGAYAGEQTGIRTDITRSVRF